MVKKQISNFEKVIAAIDVIETQFNRQLLDAEQTINSKSLQEVFTAWANISPEKFFESISSRHLKNLIAEKPADLFHPEREISETRKVQNSLIEIERFTADELKMKGFLTINYQFAESIFGDFLIASTAKGICHLMFYEDRTDAFTQLKKSFPEAIFVESSDEFQKNALQLLQHGNTTSVKLHLKASDFQYKVWTWLLAIPSGQLSTYGKIASIIGNPKASRAVGTAIGSNSIALIIPCHRVIQNSGSLGGYRWGIQRKKAMLGWEFLASN